MTPVSKNSVPSVVDRVVVSNLTLRYLTALVVMPLVLAAGVLGGGLWAALVMFGGVVGALEFFGLLKTRSRPGVLFISFVVGTLMVLALQLTFLTGIGVIWVSALLIGIAALFTLVLWRLPGQYGAAFGQVVMTLVGVIYVGLPTAFLLDIRARPDGFLWLVLILSVTWGTDTFAYFGGKHFGHRWFGSAKLAPRLSPNKTFEGALVGILGGFLSGVLFAAVDNRLSLGMLVLLATMPLLAVLGDLLESAIKRYFSVKDSHLAGFNILPGHGGVLDRVDSLLLVTVYFYVALLVGLIG